MTGSVRIEHFGHFWEVPSLCLLRRKGFRVIEGRIHSPASEIDLIFCRGELMVYVQVKARRDSGRAADAVPLRTC